MIQRLAWLLAPALGCASAPAPSVVPPPTVVSATPAALDASAEPEHESWHAAFEFELDPPRAPMRQACKVTSEGKCPYLPEPDPRTYAYDDYERIELRAVELALRRTDDPDRVRDLHYTRFRILVEHRELGDELPGLVKFVEDQDGNHIAGWAAFLLIDELAVRAFESPDRSREDVELLVHWIERVQTMQLWQLQSADDLRMSVPTLRAGALWRLALDARDRGRFGECADGFLAISEQYGDVHDRAAELLLLASDCLEKRAE